MNSVSGQKTFNASSAPTEQSITGCLLGAAVGDALGLPMEGLSRRRQQRIFPEIDGFHFLFGKGVVSDDTEHICMVAQAILDSGAEEIRFSKELAKRMRLWFLGLPPGIGFGTLRAILKLCIGFSPAKSGIYSAGNGPAMRSAIIGVCFGEDATQMKRLVGHSTRITHTDPKAEHGALAVALAAHMASRDMHNPDEYLAALESNPESYGPELLERIKSAVRSVKAGAGTDAFAAELGLQKGIGGYIYDTVPVVLHAWLRNPGDIISGLKEVIRCGGDTDTTASILGGIIGAGVGAKAIPPHLLADLWSWPLTCGRIQRLGNLLSRAMAGGKKPKAAGIPLAFNLARNIALLIVVLAHGFRRLLPPY